VYLEPRRDQTKELICQWLKDEWYRWWLGRWPWTVIGMLRMWLQMIQAIRVLPKRLIKDTSSYNHNSFLDSLAGLQSNGIEIEYWSEGLPTVWLAEGLSTGLILIDWERVLSFYLN
jgi:hypothetical protein